MTRTCTQRGCIFDSDEIPTNCPVCNQPYSAIETTIETEYPIYPAPMETLTELETPIES